MRKVFTALAGALIALPIFAEQNIAILPCAPQSISCPATINGATTLACRNLEGDGGFGTTQTQNLYSFPGTVGETVTVDLTAASAEDVQFELWQEGSWASTVQYGGGCTAEPCLHRTLSQTLHAAGTWLIAVHTYTTAFKDVTDAVGRFALAVSCVEPRLLPNLTPYQPYGWSDKIVVSRVPYVHDDGGASVLPSGSGYLFVNAAFINNGAAASSGWTARLAIDEGNCPPGSPCVHTWDSTQLTQWPQTLQPGQWWLIPNVQFFRVNQFAPGTHTMSLKVDFNNAIGESDESDNEYVKTFTVAPYPCFPSSTALCLFGSRFRVEFQWASSGLAGSSAPGWAIPMSGGDSGYFWFFNSSNAEVLVKVLDGTAINQHFWVFASGMTNVYTVMTVTDTVTGAVKTYTNPPGVAFQPIQDILAFPAP